LHPAAIFVPEREAVEQVFYRVETRTMEIDRLARADAFERLQRGRQRLVRHGEAASRLLHHDGLP
jgi:hypothetical protein